jgi:hypothetical protein
MTTSLTLQTEREIRYEQRCQKKRIEQQNMDRAKRFDNRCGLSNETSWEVSNAISLLAQKKRNVPLLTSSTRSSYNYLCV